MHPILQQQKGIINAGVSTHITKGYWVRFLLLHNHTDKDSLHWQKSTRKKSPTHLHTRLRMGVLNGSIPLAISDTGGKASASKPKDPTVATRIQSNSSLGGAFGNWAMATAVNKLHHNLWEPAYCATSKGFTPQHKQMCGCQLSTTKRK